MASEILYQPKQVYVPQSIVRVDGNLEKGLENLAGHRPVATLAPRWRVAEAISNSDYDSEIMTSYGRVLDGLLCVPQIFSQSGKVERRILGKGICAEHAKEAVEANKKGKWFSIGNLPYNEVMELINSGYLIDNADLENGVLKLPLYQNDNNYSLVIHGGEGTDEQKLKRVLDFNKKIREFPNKNLEYIPVYTPSDEEINKFEDIFATQFISGGSGVGFYLYGGSRGLNDDDGAFGVF